MQQPSGSQVPVKVERATAGFAVSLSAGVLILIQGIVRLLHGSTAEFGLSVIRHRIFGGLALQVVGVVAIVFAVLILLGAFLIYSPGKELAGGIVVLIFAVLSISTGGGFLAGLILGIVGGALGLVKK